MKLENLKKIAAPVSVVWGVTVDVERWPTWTPTIDTIERLDDGPLGIGSRARIKQPGLPQAEWRVTAFSPNREFTWETQVLGMRMVATHEMTGEGADTNNLLRIDFYGLTARLFWPLIRRSVSKALETENAGLKTACEAQAC